MSIVISVENVSKSYRLGMIGGGTLKEDFARWCAKVRGKPDPLLKIGEEHGTRRIGEQFWALENVSFEVKESEVLGIIGRNGAGKSTLLKILSQVTAPTSGQVKVKGRIGSLLEVGTGFHPELTGRENIFLNGAILGMTKAEIRGKLDEIIAFSGIEEFIDTPVKRYSSGMYVRLAFAVAAHLEPEILIIDEVLAVGDAAFQKKCLGKMGDVAKGGRTVLFVSHNMDAVRRLCQTCIWLDSGTVKTTGSTAQCVSGYLLHTVKAGAVAFFDPPHQVGNGMPLGISAVRISDQVGNGKTQFSRRSPVQVIIEWESYDTLYKPRIGFVLQTSDGFDVLTAFDANAWAAEWLGAGRRVSSCYIPGGILNEGEYVIDVGADSPKGFDFTKSRTGALLKFEVQDDTTLPNKYYGQEGFRDSRWPGVVLLDIPWVQEAL